MCRRLLGVSSMDFGFEHRNFLVLLGCAGLEGGMDNGFKPQILRLDPMPDFNDQITVIDVTDSK